jgi:two-component system cell cycle response regulator
MQTADELELRLAEAESRLQALTEQVRQNDEKLKCSQRREIQLLRAPDLDGLLHEMTEGLKESFDLPAVSVVLRDPGHDIRHLLLTADLDRNPDLIFVDTLAGLAPQYTTLLRPWLGPFNACDQGLVLGSSRGIAEFRPDAGSADPKSLGEALIARADVALYAAKAAGRDRVGVEAA